MVDGSGHGRSLASGQARSALDCDTMHVLVLADGEAVGSTELEAAWPGWDDGVERVIAADGGARQAHRLGLRIDDWVGDGDSLDGHELEALRALGVPVTLTSVDKDETDTESAIGHAVAAGATRITVLGALGGPRLDHGLANIGLLTMTELAACDVRLLGPTTRVRLLTGTAEGGSGTAILEGRLGDLVTLLPLGTDAVGVTTSHLRFPLEAERLVVGRTRGVSNVRTATRAEVHLERGRLLIIEAPATLG
jgi:thiamine pyrophosphokinase